MFVDLLFWLFSQGHWVIGLAVVIFIALVAINNGGGLFDFMDGISRYENSRTNFEFSLMTYAFPAVIIGGIIWLLFVALQPDDSPVAMNQPKRSTTAVSKVKSAPKRVRSHSHKSHQAH